MLRLLNLVNHLTVRHGRLAVVIFATALVITGCSRHH